MLLFDFLEGGLARTNIKLSTVLPNDNYAYLFEVELYEILELGEVHMASFVNIQGEQLNNLEAHLYDVLDTRFSWYFVLEMTQ